MESIKFHGSKPPIRSYGFPMVFLWFSYGFHGSSHHQSTQVAYTIPTSWTMLDHVGPMEGAFSSWLFTMGGPVTMAFHTEMTTKWMMIVWDRLVGVMTSETQISP